MQGGLILTLSECANVLCPVSFLRHYFPFNSAKSWNSSVPNFSAAARNFPGSLLAVTLISFMGGGPEESVAPTTRLPHFRALFVSLRHLAKFLLKSFRFLNLGKKVKMGISTITNGSCKFQFIFFYAQLWPSIYWYKREKELSEFSKLSMFKTRLALKYSSWPKAA